MLDFFKKKFQFSTIKINLVRENPVRGNYPGHKKMGSNHHTQATITKIHYGLRELLSFEHVLNMYSKAWTLFLLNLQNLNYAFKHFAVIKCFFTKMPLCGLHTSTQNQVTRQLKLCPGKNPNIRTSTFISPHKHTHTHTPCFSEMVSYITERSSKQFSEALGCAHREQ